MGLSAAKACAGEGAKVVVVGRELGPVNEAQSALGENGLAMQGDATNSSTAEQAIKAAVDRFNGFHDLYHVAGGSGRKSGDGPLHEISDEGWRFTMELNLNSLFYSNRAAVRKFLSQKTPGSILNMGSVLGASPSPRFFSTHAYAATKSAVIGFTRSCAAYYAQQNIRFNAVVPALVETPMSQRAVGDETVMEFIRTKQPLDGGRVGRPDDLDAAVVYFLSDASKFVTGQILTVDGGWSVTEGQIPR